MADPCFKGHWQNSVGSSGQFELTWKPGGSATFPVTIQNQDGPGMGTSTIDAEGTHYPNDQGISIIEFKFFDIHAICSVSQTGYLQGTFLSSRDHGTYFASRVAGEVGEFETLFHPMMKELLAGQGGTLNYLMNIITGRDHGEYPEISLLRGDVILYGSMPQERRPYQKWQPRQGLPQVLCSESCKVGVSDWKLNRPNGWVRFGLPQPWKAAYSVLYHGTDSSLIMQILTTTLRPGRAQEGAEGGNKAVFLTPSLIYAASPRYGRQHGSCGFSPVFRSGTAFLQVVLEVTTFCAPDKIQAETLGVGWAGGGWATRSWGSQSGGKGQAYPKEHRVIDVDFGDNYSLEHLYYVAPDGADSASKFQVTAVLVHSSEENIERCYERRRDSTPVSVQAK